MKTAVELAWCAVAFAAFLACLHTLKDMGTDYRVAAGVLLSVLGLVCVTWFTHWRER